MNHTNQIEPAAATAASVVSAAAWATNVSVAMTIAINALTLAWWIRMWIKNPNVPPPPSLPR